MEDEPKKARRVGRASPKSKPTKQEIKQAYDDLAAYLLHQYRKKQRTKNK